MDSETAFVRTIWITVGIVAVGALLVFLLWTAGDVLLLTFSAVLLAAFLHGLGRWLSRHTPLSFTWAMLVVLAVLLLAVAGGSGCWLPEWPRSPKAMCINEWLPGVAWWASWRR